MVLCNSPCLNSFLPFRLPLEMCRPRSIGQRLEPKWGARARALPDKRTISESCIFLKFVFLFKCPLTTVILLIVQWFVLEDPCQKVPNDVEITSDVAMATPNVWFLQKWSKFGLKDLSSSCSGRQIPSWTNYAFLYLLDIMSLLCSIHVFVQQCFLFGEYNLCIDSIRFSAMSVLTLTYQTSILVFRFLPKSDIWCFYGARILPTLLGGERERRGSETLVLKFWFVWLSEEHAETIKNVMWR